MESRAKETAKKTAKKGKNGIVKLIFSRIFIFALLIFLQLLVLFYFFWHVNEQFKIFYDFIRIITVFLVLYIVNEKKSDPTMKMIWSIVILIIPIFGALLYLFVKFQPTSVLLRKRLEVINHRSDNYLEYKKGRRGISSETCIHSGLPVQPSRGCGLCGAVACFCLRRRIRRWE